MRRRDFLKNSAGVGMLSGTRLTSAFSADLSTPLNFKQSPIPMGSVPGQIGRPVRVVSIAYKGHERPIDSVIKLVDSDGAEGADIIVLAETWRGLEFQQPGNARWPGRHRNVQIGEEAPDLRCLPH